MLKVGSTSSVWLPVTFGLAISITQFIGDAWPWAAALSYGSAAGATLALWTWTSARGERRPGHRMIPLACMAATLYFAGFVAFEVGLGDDRDRSPLCMSQVLLMVACLTWFPNSPARPARVMLRILTAGVGMVAGYVLALVSICMIWVLSAAVPSAPKAPGIYAALALGALGGYMAGIGPAVAGYAPDALLRGERLLLGFRQALLAAGSCVAGVSLGVAFVTALC